MSTALFRGRRLAPVRHATAADSGTAVPAAAPPWSGGLRRDVGLLTALAFAVRLFALDHQPLWRDEAFTRLVARRDLGGMLDAVRHDSAPPLAYLLAHWTLGIADTVWMLRLPAVLAGVLAVPLVAALGRRAGGDRAARCCAGLGALAPSMVLPSRDARMYALGATLVLAVLLTLWRAAERPTRGRLVGLGLATAGALLTQYLTAFAIAATVAAVALALRPSRGTLVRCGAAMAAGAIPLLAWLPAAAPQFHHAAGSFWVPPTGGAGLLGALTEWLAGPSVDPGIPHRALLQVAQGGSITLLGIAGLALIHRTALRRGTDEETRSVLLLAGAGFGGVVLLLAVSLVHPLFDARYASLLWPPLTVLLGVGIATLRPRRLGSLPLGSVAAATLLLVLVPLRADVVPLVATLSTAPAPGTVVFAHREVYLQVLLDENPAQQTVTRVPSPTLDWFWGTAAYPADALVVAPPPGTVEIDEIVQGDGGDGAEVPTGFHRVRHTCAVDACLTVWRR